MLNYDSPLGPQLLEMVLYVLLVVTTCSKTIIYQTLENNEQAYAEHYKNGFGNLKEIKLYVPKGTIVVEYDLSLEGI